MHSGHDIDPTQPVRMLLIAPSFSQTLLTRCKWIDAKISLFTYSCLQFKEKIEGIVPVFVEQSIPSAQEAPVVHTKDNRLSYITDPAARARASSTIENIKNTWQGRTTADPTKDDISLKVDNRVVAYLCPRRKNFLIYTYNKEDHWSPYPVSNDEDLDIPMNLIRDYVDRKGK